MKRRNFLRTVGLTAPAALVPLHSQPSANRVGDSASNLSPEPKAFFYDDGRHASGLYQFAPPLTPADMTYAVDQLVEAGIDTLFYSAGPEGGVVQYDSRVAQKWGDNVEVWTHEIFYRAARILHQLIADGHDPMKLLCDRSHAKGIRFIPTICVCIIGGDRTVDNGLGRKSDFAYNHPEYQVGPDNDPRGKKPARFFGPNRLSFLHPEVRKERFAICEELLTRYDTDGIELDLSIDNDFGPFCRFAEVGRLAPILTQWISDLRRIANKAAQAQGRQKQIYARIPAGPSSSWGVVGFQVPVWVSQKLVDGLICLSTHRSMLDQDLDLKAALEVTRGTQCRVLAGFEGSLGRQLESNATGPMIWAAAANAYEQGAHGFGLCEGMWAPNGWPWVSEDYQTLRLLGHPDLLATADKTYRARSLTRGSVPQASLFPVQDPILPQALAQGESLVVSLQVSDDLVRWQALERVAAVRLRVRFSNIEPSLNSVRVELNGRALPESILRKVDLHFRVLKMGAVNPYGYVYEYILTPEYYPRQGLNRIKVTLVQRDPKLKLPFEVYDLDCSIKYRLHRHFEEEPIEY